MSGSPEKAPPLPLPEAEEEPPAPATSVPDAAEMMPPTPTHIYRMSHEQIGGILSWDLPARDYEPRGFSDETMEMCGHLIMKGFQGRNKLLAKRRELQEYVNSHLTNYGFVDIDERMQYS